jgi:hypothetical protein
MPAYVMEIHAAQVFSRVRTAYVAESATSPSQTSIHVAIVDESPHHMVGPTWVNESHGKSKNEWRADFREPPVGYGRGLGLARLSADF